jgi:hypothetical protein
MINKVIQTTGSTNLKIIVDKVRAVMRVQDGTCQSVDMYVAVDEKGEVYQLEPSDLSSVVEVFVDQASVSLDNAKMIWRVDNLYKKYGNKHHPRN